jgi:hypothetical protein
MAKRGKKDRYWEMREGGPYDGGGGEQVFVCTDCGTVTRHEKGWDGEPNDKACKSHCRDNHGDWKPGRVTNSFRSNFDDIFPDAPGAGL